MKSAIVLFFLLPSICFGSFPLDCENLLSPSPQAETEGTLFDRAVDEPFPDGVATEDTFVRRYLPIFAARFAESLLLEWSVIESVSSPKIIRKLSLAGWQITRAQDVPGLDLDPDSIQATYNGPEKWKVTYHRRSLIERSLKSNQKGKKKSDSTKENPEWSLQRFGDAAVRVSGFDPTPSVFALIRTLEQVTHSGLRLAEIDKLQSRFQERKRALLGEYLSRSDALKNYQALYRASRISRKAIFGEDISVSFSANYGHLKGLGRLMIVHNSASERSQAVVLRSLERGNLEVYVFDDSRNSKGSWLLQSDTLLNVPQQISYVWNSLWDVQVGLVEQGLGEWESSQGVLRFVSRNPMNSQELKP